MVERRKLVITKTGDSAFTQWNGVRIRNIKRIVVFDGGGVMLMTTGDERYNGSVTIDSIKEKDIELLQENEFERSPHAIIFPGFEIVVKE